MTKFTKQQSGFVLVLAIGATLVLMLIASIVAINVQSLVAVANDKKTNQKFVWQAMTNRSRVVFSLLTGRKTLNGFSNASLIPMRDDMGAAISTPTEDDLRVDGRWYTMNGALFSVQDIAGLLSVNSLSDVEFEKFLAGQTKRGTIARAVSQRYRDFIDFDGNLRLNGAESYSYSQRGMLGPLNRSIFLPQELTDILDWPNIYVPWEVLHAYQLTWNINTAPQSVISLKTLSDESKIRDFLNSRNNTVYTSISNAEKNLGTGAIQQETESISFSVSDRFRLAFVIGKGCTVETQEQKCELSTSELVAQGNVKVEIVDIQITPTGETFPYKVSNKRTTALYDLMLARQIVFPLSDNVLTSQLNTFNVNGDTIDMPYKTPINDLIKINDAPIIEYQNKTLSVQENTLLSE